MNSAVPFLRMGRAEGPRVELASVAMSPVSERDAVRLALAPRAQWGPLRAPVFPREVHLPVPSRDDGVAGYLPEEGLLMRLLYPRGADPASGLREVEREAAVPPEVAAALLAAARAARPLRGWQGVSTFAKIAAMGEPPQRGPWMSREDIEHLVERAVEELASGSSSIPTPATSTDRAR